MERFTIAVTIFARVWKRNRRSLFPPISSQGREFIWKTIHMVHGSLPGCLSVQPQSLFFSWIGELG